MNGLLDYIVELIVSEDEVYLSPDIMYPFTDFKLSQAFQLIDKKPFRRLLTYLRPVLEEKNIPYHTKLCAEILTHAKGIEKKIADILKVFYSLEEDLLLLIHKYLLFRIYLENFPSRLTPGLPKQGIFISPWLGTISELQKTIPTAGSWNANSWGSHVLREITQMQTWGGFSFVS